MEEPPASILVVDDDEANRDLLLRWLEKRGHSVTTAAGGREALHLLEQSSFDLVLLDVMMPDISGLQVLLGIRERHGFSDLPVIMATARSESESIVAALALGANDHLTKPLDLHVVLARVRSQLALKRTSDQTRSLATQVELRNRFIRQMFGRYLSDDVVANLLESRQGLELGGERRRITILMSDLRGFSTITERLDPEQVVAVINNYLGVMTEIIVDCGGTIDEFIGDAILVLFGAPVGREDHPMAAAACAVRMQNAMEEVNRRNSEQGLPHVEMGIGVHTGDVVVGNIGSEKRMKYGVVGTAVNLASRIESYTVGGQILLSSATWESLGRDARERGTMQVQPKGYQESLTLHDLTAIGDLALEHETESGDLVALPIPLEIGFSIVVGKETGGAVSRGRLTRLSLKEAEVECSTVLEQWSNLKLRLTGDPELSPSGEIYAKVVGRIDEETPRYALRFTSIGPEVEARLRSLLHQ